MDEEAREENATITPRERLSRPTPVAKTKKRSKFKRWRRSIARKLGARFGVLAIALMSKTWRARWDGLENLEAARGAGGGHLITLWHGRMLVPMAHHENKGWVVLVSQSGDGDTVAPILQRYGFGVIRGSASRGGARALREMLTLLESGSVLVLTPDGPRGPMHAMNPGVVWLARATGYAVVPAGFVADRAWRMKSWDRFTIPKPFARVSFVYGKPIRVDRESTTAELEARSREIADAMHECERRAFERIGMERDA
ncbi:MAG: lysophospholipid acyltransferase family protein [Planctomycetota bacterium]|nr:lysophospholipid acyltransferase family protein [Planctomycetota bacterium]